jgi:hypothetical protein
LEVHSKILEWKYDRNLEKIRTLNMYQIIFEGMKKRFKDNFVK